MGRNVRALLFVAAALALGRCGGSGPGSCGVGETGTPPNCQKICPAGTIPPDCRPDCTQTNVYQQDGPVPAGTLVYLDFSVPDSGRLDVTLDWTNASSAVGFYLVPANTCTLAEFNARTCNFVIRAEPSSSKPRKVSLANLAAGNYRWIVANFSASDESVALKIVLAKGTGCPAFGGTPPSVLSRVGDPLPAIGRARRQ